MHCFLLCAAMKLGLAWDEMLRDVVKRWTAQELIHNNTKWLTKTPQDIEQKLRNKLASMYQCIGKIFFDYPIKKVLF